MAEEKEECEHNRPFWECEICGNMKVKKAEDENKNLSRLTKLEKRIDDHFHTINKNGISIASLETEFNLWKTEEYVEQENSKKISSLEKKFNDEATVNEEIDQEHSERIEKLETEQKLKIDYIMKMNQLEKNDKGHQALHNKAFKEISELKASSASHTEEINKLKVDKMFIRDTHDNLSFQIAELKEQQKHWATLENVTVCRLGIENIEEVLRESIDFSNLLLELFLNVGIIDEENHQKAYKEVKNMLNKLGAKEAVKSKHDEYRGKPVEERRKKYESRMTKDGVPIADVLEKIDWDKPPNIDDIQPKRCETCINWIIEFLGCDLHQKDPTRFYSDFVCKDWQPKDPPELQEPFDLRKFIEFALENAKAELPNKKQIVDYILVEKADLEFLIWKLMALYKHKEPTDRLRIEVEQIKEKYIREDKE